MQQILKSLVKIVDETHDQEMIHNILTAVQHDVELMEKRYNILSDIYHAANSAAGDSIMHGSELYDEDDDNEENDEENNPLEKAYLTLMDMESEIAQAKKVLEQLKSHTKKS